MPPIPAALTLTGPAGAGAVPSAGAAGAGAARRAPAVGEARQLAAQLGLRRSAATVPAAGIPGPVPLRPLHRHNVAVLVARPLRVALPWLRLWLIPLWRRPQAQGPWREAGQVALQLSEAVRVGLGQALEAQPAVSAAAAALWRAAGEARPILGSLAESARGRTRHTGGNCCYIVGWAGRKQSRLKAGRRQLESDKTTGSWRRRPHLRQRRLLPRRHAPHQQHLQPPEGRQVPDQRGRRGVAPCLGAVERKLQPAAATVCGGGAGAISAIGAPYAAVAAAPKTAVATAAIAIAGGATRVYLNHHALRLGRDLKSQHPQAEAGRQLFAL
jgi:hypothetical protein